MDVRELRYFIAVYEEQSVTSAARRCYVSQPSISEAIASLERELDTQLFVRHRKGAMPTSAAEQLVTVARRIVDETDSVRRMFREPKKVSTVTIGLMNSLDVARTMAVLRPLAESADVRMRLVGAEDRCDARIISKTLRTKGEGFVRLWSEHYAVALPSAHPLALKKRLLAADLRGQPFVDRCHCENGALFQRLGGEVETVAVAASEEWAVGLVALGVGMAVLPEGVVQGRPGVTVRRVADVKVAREVGLAYGATAAPVPELKAFIDRLRRRWSGKSRGERAT